MDNVQLAEGNISNDIHEFRKDLETSMSGSNSLAYNLDIGHEHGSFLVMKSSHIFPHDCSELQ